MSRTVRPSETETEMRLTNGPRVCARIKNSRTIEDSGPGIANADAP
jgi:hypothetical protein